MLLLYTSIALCCQILQYHLEVHIHMYNVKTNTGTVLNKTANTLLRAAGNFLQKKMRTGYRIPRNIDYPAFTPHFSVVLTRNV